MADSARTFKLYGAEYPLIAPPDFDFGELVDCENLFGATFDNDDMDARRMASIIYVSVRRVDQTFTVATLRKLGRAERDEIDESIRAWAREDEPAATPPSGEAPKSDDSPTEQSSDVEQDSSQGNGSVEPNDSGHLSSPQSSGSVRSTFIA